MIHAHRIIDDLICKEQQILDGQMIFSEAKIAFTRRATMIYMIEHSAKYLLSSPEAVYADVEQFIVGELRDMAMYLEFEKHVVLAIDAPRVHAEWTQYQWPWKISNETLMYYWVIEKYGHQGPVGRWQPFPLSPDLVMVAKKDGGRELLGTEETTINSIEEICRDDEHANLVKMIPNIVMLYCSLIAGGMSVVKNTPPPGLVKKAKKSGRTLPFDWYTLEQKEEWG